MGLSMRRRSTSGWPRMTIGAPGWVWNSASIAAVVTGWCSPCTCRAGRRSGKIWTALSDDARDDAHAHEDAAVFLVAADQQVERARAAITKAPVIRAPLIVCAYWISAQGFVARPRSCDLERAVGSRW